MLQLNYLGTLILISISLLFLIWFTPVKADSTNQASTHPFLKSVTQGAATGYLPDSVCEECHKSHYGSYQKVGMSQSFGTPTTLKTIENFSHNHYYHKKSDRHYEMEKSDNDLLFRRYQLDHLGKRINTLEQKVDWVLGSGNRARSYLFQVPSGKLYQLPIGWYTQLARWGMSPGYDKKMHTGIRRRVRRECMFCHNAFPEVEKDSDIRGLPHLFPTQLPHGTGCQRCHGPGERHVRTTLKKAPTIEEIRSSIVNPGKLSKQKEMQVCFQCHMLPAVKLTGIRRFGVADYSYRPGKPLNDYLLNVDIDTVDEKRSERFEINHHPYRLLQSQCFIKSAKTLNPMTCISCHNPHFKPEGRQRLEHFRDACLQCHTRHEPKTLIQTLQKTMQKDDVHYTMQQTVKGIEAKRSENFNPDNCFACHMPQRRTQDVVKVTMTDHLISKNPGTKKYLLPLEENDPIITNLELYDKANAPTGDEGEIYRVIALIRQKPTLSALDYLAKLLNRSPSKSAVPYSDLATGLIKTKRYEQAEKIIKKHLIPAGYPDSHEQLALIYIATGQAEKAINLLNKTLETTPLHAASWYNLGLAYLKLDKTTDAIKVLNESVRLDPVQEKAWYYLGRSYLLQNQNKDAIAAFKKSLEIDPTYSKSYLEIVKALMTSKEIAEARRYLIHGKKVSANPELLDSVMLQ